ncbi:MAG: hypothetical protein GC153_11005 [Alphaproteobacteria bacterium]|nr:hypothetical protein [Alphaproteobacteria bacterium]
MAYGVKQGVKAPGEFGVTDLMGLALAGAAGIIAALITDYKQKGEASALYTINQWVSTAGRMAGFGDVPLWVVVVGLIAIGAGSIFYFQPITRQGAFAQGFGLLAVLMTSVPSDIAGALQGANTAGLPGLGPAAMNREAASSGIVPAVYTVNEGARAQVYQVADSTDRFQVTITINLPDGLKGSMDQLIRTGNLRGRLHNEATNATYNLFRSAGATVQNVGNSIVIRAGVPRGPGDTNRLWVRIECEGYLIQETSADARAGEPLNWQIDMQPSKTPLFIQRLNKSYWF